MSVQLYIIRREEKYDPTRKVWYIKFEKLWPFSHSETRMKIYRTTDLELIRDIHTRSTKTVQVDTRLEIQLESYYRNSILQIYYKVLKFLREVLLIWKTRFEFVFILYIVLIRQNTVDTAKEKTLNLAGCKKCKYRGETGIAVERDKYRAILKGCALHCSVPRVTGTRVYSPTSLHLVFIRLWLRHFFLFLRLFSREYSFNFISICIVEGF